MGKGRQSHKSSGGRSLTTLLTNNLLGDTFSLSGHYCFRVVEEIMPVSSTSNGKDNSRMNGEEDSSNSDGESSSCKPRLGAFVALAVRTI